MKHFVTSRNYILVALGRSALMFINGFLIWYLPLSIGKAFNVKILGLTYSAASLVSIVIGFLGGLLSDSIGRKLVIIMDSVLTLLGVLFFVLGYLTSPILLLLSALVLYGFARIGDAAIEATIYESVNEQFLGRAISIMFTVGAIAASVGSIILGNMIRHNIELAVMLLIISSSMYVLASIFLKETIIRRRKVKRVGILQKLKEIIRNFVRGFYLARVGLLLPLIITVLMSFEVGSTFYLYPTFMRKIKDFTEATISVVYGAIPLLQTMVYPFAGIVVDKLGARRSAFITLFLQAVAVACFIVLTEPVYAGLALVTASGIGAIYNVAYRTLVIGRAPEESRATGIALINTTWDIVQTIAPTIGALLWTINPYLPFYLAVTLLYTAALTTLLIK